MQQSQIPRKQINHNDLLQSKMSQEQYQKLQHEIHIPQRSVQHPEYDNISSSDDVDVYTGQTQPTLPLHIDIRKQSNSHE